MRADGRTTAFQRTNFPGCWRNQLASQGQEGAWDPGMPPLPRPHLLLQYSLTSGSLCFAPVHPTPLTLWSTSLHPVLSLRLGPAGRSLLKVVASVFL